MNHTMDSDSRITGFRAVHPGETLAEELKERGIKQKELAKAIGIQPSHLNELIKGKRSFTTAVAMALEKELGIPYDFWMRLQYGYEHDCLVIAGGINPLVLSLISRIKDALSVALYSTFVLLHF